METNVITPRHILSDVTLNDNFKEHLPMINVWLLNEMSYIKSIEQSGFKNREPFELKLMRELKKVAISAGRNERFYWCGARLQRERKHLLLIDIEKYLSNLDEDYEKHYELGFLNKIELLTSALIFSGADITNINIKQVQQYIDRHSTWK